MGQDRRTEATRVMKTPGPVHGEGNAGGPGGANQATVEAGAE